jgi:hypothetical protein
MFCIAELRIRFFLGVLNCALFWGGAPGPILTNGRGVGNKRVAYAPTNGPQNVKMTLFRCCLLEPNEAKNTYFGK